MTAGSRRPPSPLGPRWILIYDGECGFCRRCVDRLSRWDRRQRVHPVLLQDAGALAALPPIPRPALEAAMHLVSPDGTVRAGADAMPAILRLLPFGGVLAWLFRIPGVPWLARRVYAAVARNRHRLGCGSGVCRRGR